jgi:hypothetical protein
MAALELDHRLSFHQTRRRWSYTAAISGEDLRQNPQSYRAAFFGFLAGKQKQLRGGNTAERRIAPVAGAITVRVGHALGALPARSKLT